MSTIGPAAVRDLAERFEAAGVGLLDAPMSGGVARAEKGDLVVMVGVPPSGSSVCRPLLDRLGTTVAYVGENVGTGRRSSW